MLDRLTDHRKTCLQKAAKARERAQAAADPDLRDFHAKMEQRWSHLADSIAYVDRVDRMLRTRSAGPPARTCWRCHARMRLTVAEASPEQDRLTFECAECGQELIETVPH